MNDKELYMKKGVFSLEYDKETLRDMVLELQSNWNSLREWLLEKAKGKLYFTEYDEILDKMNELEGVDNENN